jgi:DHA2 family multidrug resistance protein
MSMATFAGVPVKDVSKATGLYNLTRQLGGSIGIAVLTTVLSSRQAFHRSVLVEKLGISDVATLDRVHSLAAGFMAKGFDAESARRQALTVLDGSVNLQSSVMSFADSFWLVAIVFVCTMPLLFLLGGKGKGSGGLAADAH